MIEADSIFKDLFIFEMANNHQGDMEHASKIIQEVAALAQEFDLNAGIKFQFRDLETLIHPLHQQQSSLKHVPRFFSTRLNLDQYAHLKHLAQQAGLLTICTPFDEISVDNAVRLDFDILKIASCSANDWPLLKKMCEARKPLVLSTAGISWPHLDLAVDLLTQKSQGPLAVLHCVALYPTPEVALNLQRISQLRSRYPGWTVGYSTHESPDDFESVQLAYAAGARVFEKHVGLPHPSGPLNMYSAQPAQLRKWIQGYQQAVRKMKTSSSESMEKEQKSLAELKRGAYAKTNLAKGQLLTAQNTYFAMPFLAPAHLAASDWVDHLKADRDYLANEPIHGHGHSYDEETSLAGQYSRQVMDLLQAHKITVPKNAKALLSHHFGLEQFSKVGATLFTIYNVSYCKKLIVLLPGQSHPEHQHLKREETFQVVAGELSITLNGENYLLKVGELIHIPPGTWHHFSSPNGAVIEEVSSRYTPGDSIYRDTKLMALAHDQRTTDLVMSAEL